jgi:hypothetical protein
MAIIQSAAGRCKPFSGRKQKTKGISRKVAKDAKKTVKSQFKKINDLAFLCELSDFARDILPILRRI